jgi:hypothetical protein
MLKLTVDSGFFSTCSTRLYSILSYFNEHRTLPTTVDTSEQFGWYKHVPVDITFTYFQHYDTVQSNIKWTCYIDDHDKQFDDYKAIDYELVLPFIQKYFTPSPAVKEIIDQLEREYEIDYENTCVLFYRGNDKITEASLCSYDDVIEKANEILAINPNIRFLIQSDETEFIEEMTKVFPNSFWFEGDIRHMNRQIGTVDRLLRDNIHSFSQKYLAITILMSRCKYIICGSGNCSVWIAYYRGNAEGIYQFLHDSWV